MSDLSKLNDKQSLLLTQLSYYSDILSEQYEHKSIKEIYDFEKADVADEDLINCLETLCDNGLGDLQIQSTGNNWLTGFGAVSFTDSKGNTGISYRGTDGISIKSVNDWSDNIVALGYGTSIQSYEAELFFSKNMNSSGNNFLFGHSKGGELSESVYVNHYSEIKGVHLLNPQPLNPYSLAPDQVNAMQSEKLDIVVNEEDYVWFLGTLPTHNMRIAKKKDGENPHLFSAVQFKENGDIEPGTPAWWEFPSYLLIKNFTMTFQFAFSSVGALYNSNMRVINFLTKGDKNKAYEYIKSIKTSVLSFGNELLDFVNALSEFLMQTIARVEKLYNKSQNVKAHTSESCSTEIKVDTYELRKCAERLSRVRQRVNALNNDIENLYRATGLKDLYLLIQSGVISKQDYKLLQCISYFNDTAEDFDNAEREISYQI